MKIPCKVTVHSFRVLPTAGSNFSSAELLAEEALEDALKEENLPSGPVPRDSYLPRSVPKPEAIPMVTEMTSLGLFSREEDGSFRISYEDSEVTGMEGCLTTFSLSPSGILILLRQGTVKTCLVFEEGHRHLCDYGIKVGLPSMVIDTARVEHSLSEKGGRILADYSVEIRGSRTEKNRITLTVQPLDPIEL